MPDNDNESKKNVKQDGLITELKIPQELIVEKELYHPKKQHRFAGMLSMMRVIALLSWVVAVLAIVLRLNDSTRDYGFTSIVGGSAKQMAESAQRVFILVAAAALTLSSVGCLVGAILCAKGAGKKPGDGRMLLILAVLSLLMAAVLYFFW